MQYTHPEAAGISSAALLRFLQRLEQKHIPLHSVLMARKNQLFFEVYAPPYDRESFHRMYSVGKSLTALAIGHLSDTGRLDLSDPIIQYFPEYVSEPVPKELATMTISHMLSMQTCHSFTTYKKNPDSDWVRSFFETPPSHMPGTVFTYDTSSTHTLSALVEKLSGVSLMTYLRESFLDQIGFHKDADFLRDPFGVSMGGSGLMARPYDLMLVGQLLLADGIHEDHQLLSQEFLKKATSFCVSTSIQGPIYEEKQGYGYQIWQTQHSGYAFYGLGGQYLLCYPEKELCIVITGDTIGYQGANQCIFDAIYEEIFPHLHSSEVPVDLSELKKLHEQISNFDLAPVKDSFPHINRLFLPERVLSNEYIFSPNSSGFHRLHLSWDATTKKGSLHLRKDEDYLTLPFSFENNVLTSFPIYGQRCAISAAWVDDDNLLIRSQLLDTSIGSIHFHLSFHGSRLSLYMKKFEENLFNEFQGYFEAESD